MKLYLCEVLGDDSGSRLRSWSTALNSTLLGIEVGAEEGQEGEITKGTRKLWE